ncbi:SAYSvFN domain-containing protein 1 [Salmo salar]|uniref:C6orf64 n=1 Tax=Salmo salar TaxID=8030 RepID=B5X766_SALSA|nr:SAYSvFN domain-containing protein 1 [Salmo salar]ACI66686.1 C6orf64 [Salmo salar]ACN10299.1 C6orf64 [Salmo salar]ACN12659.1 C6orf64 [Salmo salar]|eukprot:XP_014000407.1 PREDICTED: SAYSvFN domain-containing protein 1-like [Salmo salar]
MQPITSPGNSGNNLKSASWESTADTDSLELTKHPMSAVPQATGTLQWGDDCLLDCILGRRLGSRRLGFANRTLLKVLLWLVLLGVFAELGFGLPFFLISLFYWLYQGLRSPTKLQPGELSAYSVFNPDCQPLIGTLTTEQLDCEMGILQLTM